MRLDPFLEGRERAGPEVIEVLAQGINGLGIDGIHPPGPGGSICYQVGAFGHAEMLRNRRPAHRELAGKFAHGQGTVKQTRQDGAPRGIAEGVELGFMVSIHLR